ncbi:MAG TPA: glutathione peroxidase [Ramlibacter sp.]|nr:glutathione peroxidase [Ramlibacter sp.]
MLGFALSGSAPAAPPQAAGCPAAIDYTFPRLQDEKPQALCQYAGKVILVVNTASYCGYTPQYQGLEALHAKYNGRGLVVLGFPSNDFEQEKASNKEIAEFCENTYGVKFPMFGASHVKGAQANALYKQLAKATGQEPEWNFYKYLVSRDGRIIAVYPSKVTPSDPQLVAAIEKQLAVK